MIRNLFIRTLWKSVFVGTCILLMVSVYAENEGKDYASGLQNVTSQIITPHFTWAESSPLQDKTILFLVPRNNGREIVELWQRMPFKYSSVLWGGGHPTRQFSELGEAPDNAWEDSRVFSETHEKSIPHILARLTAFLGKNPDVLVMSGQVWKFLPEDLKSNIFKKIKAGMGLAVFQPQKDFVGFLGNLDDAKISTIPEMGFNLSFLNKTSIRELTLGKGRIVSVSYPGKMRTICFFPRASHYFKNTRKGQDNPTLPNRDFETVAAHVLSIIKRASGVITSPSLSQIKVSAKVNWATANSGNVQVSVNSDIPCRVSLKISVMDVDFIPDAVIEKEFDLRKGKNKLSISLPSAPCGRKILVAQLKENGKVFSFGAAEYEIISETSISLKPEKELFYENESVSFSVNVQGHQLGDKLELLLKDFWGRITNRIEKQIETASEKFTFKNAVPLSKVQTICCILKRDDKALQKAKVNVFRKLNETPGKFYLFGWDGIRDNTPMKRNYSLLQKQYGRNMAFYASTKPHYSRVATRMNMENFTITGSGARSLDKLCDKSFLETQKKELIAKIDQVESLGGQIGYSYGDELYVRGWKPEARNVYKEPAKSAFISYLKIKYENNIENLNKVWGGGFKSFEDFEVPVNIDIPAEPRAPWLDYAMFIENAAVNYYDTLADAVHVKYPHVSIGFDGLEQFSCFDGINIYDYQKKHNTLILYKHIDHSNKMYSWKACADFKKPGTFGGIWLGYDSDMLPEVAGTFPWQSLFLGQNSIAFFQFYDFIDKYAAFYPDYRPRPAFGATAREVKRITGGVDKLLLDSSRQHSRVGVHYSSRSFALSFPESGIKNHINELGNYDIHNTYKKNHLGNVSTSASAFLLLMNDCGYQPRMVATQEIESGALKDYKVFFMPFSQSLTDKEITEIKSFVKNGGFLITDYGCGIRDENGNLNSNGGSLDDVFGIKQKVLKGIKQPVIISDAFRSPGRRTRIISCSIDETVTGGDLELRKPSLSNKSGKTEKPSKTIGTAKDGTPVMVSSVFGKGAACYMNFTLDPYLRLRRAGKELPLRELVFDIIESVGKEIPLVRIVHSESGSSSIKAYNNLPESGVETTFFRDGELEYVGMVWDYKCPDWKLHDVKIFFTTPAYTYDVLSGKYHGFTDHIETTAAACSVKLYARLPYKVENLKITASSESKKGEKTVIDIALKTFGGKTIGRHVIRTEVAGPDGKKLEAYSKVQNMLDGKTTFSWTPALNDVLGTYTFTCSDITSGMKESVLIHLKGNDN